MTECSRMCPRKGKTVRNFTGEITAGERGSAGTTEVPVWARYAGPFGSFAENGRAVRAGGGSAVVPEGELTGKPGHW